MNETELFENLIQVNRHRLVPEGAPPPDIIDIKIGPKQFRREDMYHQPVSVLGETGGQLCRFELWVKHRPGIDEAFATLDRVYSRMGDGIFPKPILGWHSFNGARSLLLMTRVEGKTLRDRLMQAALLRRTAVLKDVFASNGAKMRRFHDASEASDSVPVEQFVARAHALVDRTPFFTSAEKLPVHRHVDGYGRALRGLRVLPLRRIHHDWTLRNVLVDKKGVDRLVDFDSIRGPVSSRWIEVTCLLFNLESQAKWSPLVTRDMVSDLWGAFWRGYADGGIPECTPDAVPAVIFLARLYHLLGGTFRVPLFEKHRRVIDRRFIAAVKRGVLEGRPALLAWPSMQPLAIRAA